MIATASWICLLAPLAAAILITLAGTHISRALAAWISILSTFVGFAGAVVAFAKVVGEEPDNREHLSTAYTWFQAGGFKVSMQILVDPISLTMMLIVTGIGGLIILYSLGYMAGEDEERRYFAYMSLFVFSMLMLVMGGNLLLLLAGWGLVGLASYLLIGYYHDRPEAIAAAKKAFIMNAIGDAAMALGLFVLIARSARSTSPRPSTRPRAASSPRTRRTSSRSASSAAPSRSRPSCRCRRGFRTRWKAPPRSPPSSTRRRWSPPAST